MTKLSGITSIYKKYNSGLKPVNNILGSTYFATNELSSTALYTVEESYDYYVDQVDGNDSNSGTSPSSAWKTIGKISAFNFAAGARVGLKRGCVWRETWYVNDGGNNSNHIIYGAYGKGDLPKITSCDLVTGWTVDSGNRYKANYTNSIDIYILLENDVMATKVGSAAAVNGPGKFFFDDTPNIIYYWTSDGSNPNTKTMEVGARYNSVVCDDRQYIDFYNLHFHGAGGQYGANFEIRPTWQSPKDISIVNCKSSNAYYCGIWATYATGMTSIDNFGVYGTEVNNNSTFGIRVDGENTSNKATNTVINGCHIHNNGNAVFGFYGAYLQFTNISLITGCLIHDNDGFVAWGDNVYVESSTHLEVSYNTVYGGNHHGLHFDVNSNYFICKYNTVYNTADSAIAVEEHLISNGASVIYGNTSYNCLYGLVFGPGGSIFEVSGVTVKNNLWAFSTRANIELGEDGVGHSYLDNTMDHNSYWVNTDSPSYNGDFRAQNPRVNLTFSQWKNYTAWDFNSINVNPLLSDTNNNDFSLSSNSPAINAGENLGSTYTKAINGNQDTLWDIGSRVSPSVITNNVDNNTYDYSVAFDGVKSRVAIFDGSYNADIDGLAQGTIEWWFKSTSTGGYQKMLYKSAVYDFGIRDNGIPFGDMGDFGAASVSNNQWHHFAVSWNGSFMSVWIDGIYIRRTAFGTLPDSVDTMYLGRRNSTEELRGYMTEFRISNIARYTTLVNFTPSTSRFSVDVNTKCLLHMNEGSGTTTVDAVGQHNGALQGGASWATISPFT